MHFIVGILYSDVGLGKARDSQAGAVSSSPTFSVVFSKW